MLTTRHGVRVLGHRRPRGLPARWPAATRWSTCSPTTAPARPTSSRAGSAARCGGASSTESSSPPATSAPTWCRCRPTEDDARAFAERAARPGPHGLHRRRARTTAVAAFWDGVGPRWGRPRDALGPAAPGDRRPAARRARPATYAAPRRDDLAALYPACVAMYTEEVGVSPEYGGGADALPRPGHASWSPAAGRSPASRTGRVVFKAEVACATPYAAQVQGVWVTPDRRGEGLAAAGMAAVVELRPRRDRARSSRSTSTSATSRPARPTSGSASGRRDTFARSCSEPTLPSVTLAEQTALLPASSRSAASSTWSGRRSTSRCMPDRRPEAPRGDPRQRRRMSSPALRACSYPAPGRTRRGRVRALGCVAVFRATSRWPTTRDAAAARSSRRGLRRLPCSGR